MSAGRCPRPARRRTAVRRRGLGPDHDQVRAGSVQYEVGRTAQHPPLPAPLGADAGLGLVEPGHRGGERAVRDPRQILLARLLVPAVQQGMRGEDHRGQQRRAVQRTPRFLHSHGQFGEGEAGPAELLRNRQPMHPDLAREPRPQRLVVSARGGQVLADVLGATLLGEEVPQDRAQFPLFLGLGQQLGIDVGVTVVHGVSIVLGWRSGSGQLGDG